jgi:hypothetical protein
MPTCNMSDQRQAISMAGKWVMLLVLGATACDRAPGRRPESFASTAAEAKIPNSRCKLPVQTAVILERDGAILETWTLRLEEVANDALPDDPAFLAYRAAIERARADVLRPVADPAIVRTEAEEEVRRNEHFNNELVFSRAVGSIDRISCLDALLFARQASRISQIDHPTEFLASVLKRETGAGTDLVVVFGAGSEMFPPKEVYGFEVVNRFRAEGWSYWYVIHNHTVQRNGDLLALGVPAPSTSDVQLYRSLAGEMGLESLRVTNGFYTFSASVDELSAFRAR